MLQGVGHLGDQEGGRPEVPARRAALPLALPDVLGQRATAADQLLGDVVGSVLLAHGEDRDDAGVGLPAAGLGLAAELLHRPLGEAQVGSQHLQGHPSAKGSLLRLVHGGRRARADLPEDAELAQGGGGHAGFVAVARPVVQPPEEALELLREGRVLRQRVRIASGPARGGGLTPRALLALGPTALFFAHGASSSGRSWKRPRLYRLLGPGRAQTKTGLRGRPRSPTCRNREAFWAARLGGVAARRWGRSEGLPGPAVPASAGPGRLRTSPRRLSGRGGARRLPGSPEPRVSTGRFRSDDWPASRTGGDAGRRGHREPGQRGERRWGGSSWLGRGVWVVLPRGVASG